MVPAAPRFNLPDRLRLTVGADRWPDRIEWSYSGRPIPSGRPGPIGRSCLVGPADFMLAQFERRISAFSLRERRCCLVAVDFWNRAGAFARDAACLLSFAHRRRPNFSQLPMGHSPCRNRFPRNFPRAMATLVEKSK